MPDIWKKITKDWSFFSVYFVSRFSSNFISSEFFKNIQNTHPVDFPPIVNIENDGR
jgi:hypothetical protein